MKVFLGKQGQRKREIVGAVIWSLVLFLFPSGGHSQGESRQFPFQTVQNLPSWTATTVTEGRDSTTTPVWAQVERKVLLQVQTALARQAERRFRPDDNLSLWLLAAFVLADSRAVAVLRRRAEVRWRAVETMLPAVSPSLRRPTYLLLRPRCLPTEADWMAAVEAQWPLLVLDYGRPVYLERCLKAGAVGRERKEEQELVGVLAGAAVAWYQGSTNPRWREGLLLSDRAGWRLPGLANRTDHTLVGQLFHLATGARTEGIFPWPAVTWEGVSPDTPVWVVAHSPQQLKVLAYNFSSQPRTVNLLTWELEAGAYYLSSGPDEDGDGVLDHLARREQRQVRRGRGLTWLLPPQQLTVLALRQTAAERAKGPCPDLAVGEVRLSAPPRSGKLLTLTATVHNLGRAAARNVQVQFVGRSDRGDFLIAERSIAYLPAPLNGQPQSIGVTVPWRVRQRPSAIEVVVDAGNEVREINERNNVVRYSVGPER